MLKLNFDNKFIRELSADSDMAIQPRQVFNAHYSYVKPTFVSTPNIVSVSPEMLEELDISDSDSKSDLFREVFVGNKLLDGMKPFAMCYGGHQFGHWAGQLGDGRAINLGEVITSNNKRWLLQLKGAGLTPYSRTADGLAVLRSSIREFLCSEAMHHLGVPTTRALSLIVTGEEVLRDMFYDGRAKYEPGAVVCRVAPSFIRFGNFEIFASREDYRNLKKLIEYCITTDYPHLGNTIDTDTILRWYREVGLRTADMVVHWMRVGFVHGVMNTDNMSIYGQTIDYGPYGWLDDYDPNWTPNTTDFDSRRYCYGNQPQIAMWNLMKLGSALYDIVNETKELNNILEECARAYQEMYLNMMGQKIGLKAFNNMKDKAMISELLTILSLVETDMTLFFRNLMHIKATVTTTESDKELIAPLKECYYQEKQLTDENIKQIANWIRQYKKRLSDENSDDIERQKQMNTVNPKYVLRNYIAQLAIEEAERGNYKQVNELLELLKKPYEEQKDKERYFARRPDWARDKPGCSTLSCSS